ncbi:MAG TPA: pyridoxamine 5'-phosphate oxidase family protein [Chryseolinea sp.]|nr:pyridoxamine 5'-phosphate oxidase family protein [Chryseolinea sp.]
MEQIISEKEEAVKKFKELVKDVSVCMFTTMDDHNNLYSRPMSTVNIDDEGNAWFFTNEFSETIQEVSKDNNVHLIYAHPAKNVYVTVKGSCTVILNRKKIDELWTPLLKAWFPNGKEDPKLCLVKVVTEEASYWNSNSGSMGVYFKMLKAIANREKYQEKDVGKLKL